MRTLLTALLLTGSALAAPLTITPSTQEVQPGSLIILTASELSNWTTSAGILGSVQGTRIVLEAPRTAGTVTITVTDPKDATRRAFAVVNVLAPRAAANSERLSTIAAGGGFSAAIATDGTVWVWGNNRLKVLPTSPQEKVILPTRIEGLSGFRSISADPLDEESDATRGEGTGHLVGLDTKANAWQWGGTNGSPNVAAAGVDWADYGECDVVLKSGTLQKLRGNGLKVAGINFVETSFGSLWAINKEGKVFYGNRCGDNTLEAVDTSQEAVQISGFLDDTALLLNSAGDVFLLKDGLTKPLPGFNDVAKVLGAGLLLKKDGRVFLFSYDGNGNPTIPMVMAGVSDIVDISASETHALALRKDGTLFAVGKNEYGQLGNGTTTNSATFVPVIGLKVKVP